MVDAHSQVPGALHLHNDSDAYRRIYYGKPLSAVAGPAESKKDPMGRREKKLREMLNAFNKSKWSIKALAPEVHEAALARSKSKESRVERREWRLKDLAALESILAERGYSPGATSTLIVGSDVSSGGGMS
jgi:hypothetical protein